MNGILRSGPLSTFANPLMDRGPVRTQSPEVLLGGVTPSVNTIMASPLAERLAGTVIQQQQQAIESQIVDIVRKALQFLAQRKRLVDPKQAANIERMAAQLLTYFPTTSQPSLASVKNMASEVQPSVVEPMPGPITTGPPLP